jgi:MFS family permease
MFSDGVNRRTGSLKQSGGALGRGMMFSIAMMITFPLVGYLGDRLGLRWGVMAGALITALLITPVALSLTSSATKNNEAA